MQGFPCGSVGKESTCNAADLGFIPGLRRSPAEGKGNPLQYSGLKSSMDCIVHGVSKSWTWLSNFHFVHFKVYNIMKLWSQYVLWISIISYVHKIKKIEKIFLVMRTFRIYFLNNFHILHNITYISVAYIYRVLHYILVFFLQLDVYLLTAFIHFPPPTSSRTLF